MVEKSFATEINGIIAETPTVSIADTNMEKISSRDRNCLSLLERRDKILL
jgi:chorismate mutase